MIKLKNLKVDFFYIAIWLVILTTLTLTIISLSELCSENCSEAHKWRIFGVKFETFGLVFFSIVAITHLLSFWYPILQLAVGLFFYLALGAELMFIIAQKYMIGAWCPICLSIAGCIFVGTALITVKLYILRKKEKFMFQLRWKILPFIAIFLGFFSSFIGLHKHDYLQAREDVLQNNIAFGKIDSNIEVYLFTDWACPACRNLEPIVKPLTLAIEDHAKVTFVDHAVHPETLNFMPYHLSFMLKNKKNYFELRKILTDISVETSSPTDEDIEASLAKIGMEYQELNYADIAICIKYFKKLAEKFNIKGTPTLVIINREAKKGKKLTGNDEITIENTLKAINTLKNL